MSKSISPDARYMANDMTPIGVGDVVRIGQGRILHRVERHSYGPALSGVVVHAFYLKACLTGRRRTIDVPADATSQRVTLVQSLDEQVFGEDAPILLVPSELDGKPARAVRVSPSLLPSGLTAVLIEGDEECVFLVDETDTAYRVAQAITQLVEEFD